jgi:Zn-finger protein
MNPTRGSPSEKQSQRHDCPLYPCLSSTFGGRYGREDGKLGWDCTDCGLLHDSRVGDIVSAELARFADQSEASDLTLTSNWEDFFRVRRSVFHKMAQLTERPKADGGLEKGGTVVDLSRIPGVKKALQVTGNIGTVLLAYEENEERDAHDFDIFNLGLRDVLDRNTVLLIGHDSELPIPPEPILVLLVGGEIMGEVSPPHIETSRRGGLRSGRDFSLYPPRTGMGLAAFGPFSLIYPPTSFPYVGDLPGITNVCACTLGERADSHARELLGITELSRWGTILVGFDLRSGALRLLP